MSRRRRQVLKEPSYEEATSRLWELTQTDWNVRVSNVLTEPVCAYVDLWPDDKSFPSLMGFIGTSDLNESVRLACEALLQQIHSQGQARAALASAPGAARTGEGG